MDPYRARVVQTVVLVFTWINMGLNMNMLYAVLPDILTRTNSTVEEISVAFSIGNFGGLMVPFFAIFADRLVAYEEAIMGLFLLVCGVAVGMRGFATHVWQHAVSSTLESFFWGGINAVGQSALLRQWGSQSGPAMQAIHMGFPIGAILAPFLAVPFVSDTGEDTDLQLTATYLQGFPCRNDLVLRYRNTMLNSRGIASLKEYAREHIAGYSDRPQFETFQTTDGFNIFDDDDVEADSYEYADDSSIEIALGICAIYTFTIGIAHLILQFLTSLNKRKISKNNNLQIAEVGDNKEKEVIKEPKQKLREIISFDNWAYGHALFGCGILACTCFFFACHMAATIGIMSYLVTYAVDSDLGFSNEEAAWMQMTVSIAAAFSRGICILISKKVSLNVMLAIELHGQLLMAIIMLIWGTQSYAALWVTSCIYVLFREPTWPSGMTWPNSFIIMLVFLMAILQISISITAIPLQLWQGYLYTNKSPDSIFYTTIVFGALNCVVFYVMLHIGRRAPNREEAEKLGSSSKSLNNKTPLKTPHVYTNASYKPDSNAHVSSISSNTYL